MIFTLEFLAIVVRLTGSSEILLYAKHCRAASSAVFMVPISHYTAPRFAESVLSSIAATATEAAASADCISCAYMFSVVLAKLCPSKACTVLGFAPLFIRSVAFKCLRLCTDTKGKLYSAQNFFKNVYGVPIDICEPLSVVNTRFSELSQ